MSTTKTTPGAFRFTNSGYRGDVHGTVTYSADGVSWTNTVTGDEVPRFREVIRDGGCATSNLSGTKYEVVDAVPYAFSCYYGPPYNDTEKFTGYDRTPFFGTVFPVYTTADSAALGKYYASARNAISSMKGQAFVGELAETIHMLKHPGDALFKGVESYLDRLKKIDSRLPARTKRQLLASTYLEYVFGWIPLISDMKDALKALEQLHRTVELIPVSGFGNEVKLVSSGTSRGNMNGGNLAPTLFSTVVTTESQVRYYGRVRGTVQGPSLQKAMDSFGFKLDEFIPAVWEVLPWSFLIDYFTNIGDIVSAATFVNSQLAWTSRTNRFENKVVYQSHFDEIRAAQAFPYPCYRGGGTGTSGWTAKKTEIVRTKAVTPGIPSLRFELPGSSTRWANIAALALQNSFLGRRFL
jgi:hypothetical protein